MTLIRADLTDVHHRLMNAISACQEAYLNEREVIEVGEQLAECLKALWRVEAEMADEEEANTPHALEQARVAEMNLAGRITEVTQLREEAQAISGLSVSERIRRAQGNLPTLACSTSFVHSGHHWWKATEWENTRVECPGVDVG